MTVEDLMIGNWVKVSKGNWSENRQINLITMEMIAECIYLAEPIPITTDILEKNGFRRYSGDAGDRLAEYIIYDDVIWWKGNIYIYNENKILYDDIDVHYVHQLQQFLKLVQEDKEIIL